MRITRWLSLSVLPLLLLALTPARVSIAVTPVVVMAGASVRVTCTVPQHPDNRWLVIGVYYEGGVVYQASERQLDGEAAPVTHVMTVTRVPCEAAVAQCYVIPAVGPQFRVNREITVGACSAP